MKKILCLSALLCISNANASPIATYPSPHQPGIPVIENGSFNGPVQNVGVPAGWLMISESPDTLDPLSNVGVPGLGFSTTPSASPDGGTWVGLGRQDDFIETLGQQISGFSAGSTYTLSWLHGNFGYEYYNASNAIEVLLDGLVIGSGTLLELGSRWVEETLSFTATAQQHEIAFRLRFNDPSYHSIDGVRLTSVTSVSEPASWALFLLALGLSVFTDRRFMIKAQQQG